METWGLTSQDLYQWVLVPGMIFFARMLDVTIGTVRILLLAKGKRKLVPILGFCELLIWLLAVQQVFLNLNNVACYLAFAGGFAAGNYVGMIIEEKLAIGHEVVRIITKQEANELLAYFTTNGIGFTNVPATGAIGPVNVIFTIVDRTRIPQIVQAIKRFNPKAFYTVEDVKTVNEGVFPLSNRRFALDRLLKKR